MDSLLHQILMLAALGDRGGKQKWVLTQEVLHQFFNTGLLGGSCSQF